MLRRTAARAFGAPDPSGRTGGAPPGARRGLAVDVLFEDLREALLAAVAPPAPPAGDPPDPAAESPGPASEAPPPLSSVPAPSPVEVSPSRPRVEGIEFTVDGPAGRLRCIHTLKGFLRVRVERRGIVSESLVTLHATAGGLRPIEKPLPRGGESVRTPFRYTSVPELVAGWLEKVRDR